MEFCRAVPSRWLMLFVLIAFPPSSVIHGQSSYDLVLKGGHVIDPKNGIDGIRDVAFHDEHAKAECHDGEVDPPRTERRQGEDRADRDRGDDQSLGEAAEGEVGLDEEQGAGDDAGVVAEQQAAEAGDRGGQHDVASRPSRRGL